MTPPTLSSHSVAAETDFQCTIGFDVYCKSRPGVLTGGGYPGITLKMIVFYTYRRERGIRKEENTNKISHFFDETSKYNLLLLNFDDFKHFQTHHQNTRRRSSVKRIVKAYSITNAY